MADMEGPYVSLAEFMAAERLRASLPHATPVTHSTPTPSSMHSSLDMLDKTEHALRTRSYNKLNHPGGQDGGLRRKTKSKSYNPPPSNKHPALPLRSKSSALHRGVSPPRPSLPFHDSTFALTATAQHQVDSPNSTFLEPLSPLLVSRPATCISMATTMSSSETGSMMKKAEVRKEDKGSQCSMQDLQEIEGTLRRYFFSHNPAQGALLPYLHSHSRSKSPLRRSDEAREEAVEEGETRRPDEDRYYSCMSSLGSSKGHQRLRRRIGSREPAMTRMYFYEVLMTEDRTFPRVDYSTDYRRFSYTDFKVPEDVGRSNISPEAIAEWILEAQPRNQDDVYPLLVLCKDLVRKYHLREVYYTIKKESSMREEVEELTRKLQSSSQKIDLLCQEIRDQDASYSQRVSELTAEIGSLRIKVEEAESIRQRLEEAEAALREERENLKRVEESSSSSSNMYEMQVRSLAKKEKQLEEENSSLTKELRSARENYMTLDQQLLQERKLSEELREQVKQMSNLSPDQLVQLIDPAKRLPLLKTLLGDGELVGKLSKLDGQEMPDKSQDSLLRCVVEALDDRGKSTGKVNLDVEGVELYNSVVGLLSRDFREYEKFVGLVDVSSTGSLSWKIVRDAMESQGRGGRVTEALKLLLDADGKELGSRLFDVSLQGEEELEELLELFKRWYEGRGRLQGLQETDEAQQKRQKYNLFDMTNLEVEPFPLEETLWMIGEIIDFKFEADYENESEQRPRLNLVKTIRSFMVSRFVHKSRSDENTRRLCAAILRWQEQSPRVRIFGICSGMLEIESHWTERSVCVLMLFWQQLKVLSDPGQESLPPEERGEGWSIFGPWLGAADRMVAVEHVRQSVQAACDSPFAFGPMEGFEEALEKEEQGGRVSLDRSSELFMSCWFDQFDRAKQKLRELFVAFDVNHDETLEISEFIQLLRATPMRIRQHDAINLFNELAGPDDTMDEEEFAEILVFYKFNTRHLLSISTER
ncbi:hypothetical protein GUITHDRAFT_141620 [Guillardia theta CCMP2712]|uniref:EF-hand domain-containing protein n=2 Tax=Guillardia theta TaxID=55529 RepID=L1J1A3_GUITC|nr:hypothetical protein GUITHDRAFT_141620 [Guillardia theta CCMP2712]EKX41865.1 hypothetical protein GUITHDRAFT_141620 [Guillardia theta CCMP2712]|eukprot:XP_005828845.1 hypothetical protein GUITHDRAFT_141620 [Guillardia theta CCMP2712]